MRPPQLDWAWTPASLIELITLDTRLKCQHQTNLTLLSPLKSRRPSCRPAAAALPLLRFQNVIEASVPINSIIRRELRLLGLKDSSSPQYKGRCHRTVKRFFNSLRFFQPEDSGLSLHFHFDQIEDRQSNAIEGAVYSS